VQTNRDFCFEGETAGGNKRSLTLQQKKQHSLSLLLLADKVPN
jgi:hypothetical protein